MPIKTLSQLAAERAERAKATGRTPMTMAERQALIKARQRLNAVRRDLPPLTVMEATVVPEEASELADINAAIDKLKPAKVDKLSAEERAKWDARHKRMNEIKLRQADQEHYVVLCFETGGQAGAFVRQAQMRQIFDTEGNVFLDGRQLAAFLQIPLEAPEYALTTNVSLAKGKSLTLPKVPKGYKKGDEG